MKYRGILQLLFLTAAVPAVVAAENLSLEAIIQFPSFVELPSNWHGELDCRSTPGISIRAGMQLREDLVKELQTRGVSVNENARRKASLYITDFICGRDGVEDETELPLSLANFTDKNASFIARAILEVTDSKTGRLLDSKEIQIKGIISEKANRVLFFSSGTSYQDVTEPMVWEELSKEIVGALVAGGTDGK